MRASTGICLAGEAVRVAARRPSARGGGARRSSASCSVVVAVQHLRRRARDACGSRRARRASSGPGLRRSCRVERELADVVQRAAEPDRLDALRGPRRPPRRAGAASVGRRARRGPPRSGSREHERPCRAVEASPIGLISFTVRGAGSLRAAGSGALDARLRQYLEQRRTRRRRAATSASDAVEAVAADRVGDRLAGRVGEHARRRSPRRCPPAAFQRKNRHHGMWLMPGEPRGGHAQDRDEAAEEDRLRAVLLEEPLRGRQRLAPRSARRSSQRSSSARPPYRPSQ